MECPVKIISGVDEMLSHNSGDKFDLIIKEPGLSSYEISKAFIIPTLVKSSCILLSCGGCQLYNNFYEAAGYLFVYDKTLSRKFFLRMIDHLFTYCFEKNSTLSKYSKNEIDVIFRLIKGYDITSISRELNISYKMVSHYKNSALDRIGAKSIVDVIRCNNINML